MSLKIDENGNRFWLNSEDQRYRIDGPAVEWNGNKLWWVNDELHRSDGPACEYSNGTKYWYIKGKEYTKKEFNNVKDSGE